jgi:hypothetical protein
MFRFMTELRRHFSPSFGRRPYVSHAMIFEDLVTKKKGEDILD